MADSQNARAAGQRAALITAAIGLLIALLLVLGFGLSARSANGWLVVGFTVAIVTGFAYAAGGSVGVYIKSGGNPWLSGIGLALATVIVPALVVSLGAWAVQTLPLGMGRAIGELNAYVLKPLFWIVPIAVIPACALGVVYAQLVRRRL